MEFMEIQFLLTCIKILKEVFKAAHDMILSYLDTRTRFFTLSIL